MDHASRQDADVELLTPESDGVARAAELLRAGRLVALPTETVYGLGADATDATAAARIFQAKRRPHFDPLIVHVASQAAAVRLTGPLSPAESLLARAFWPGPLTLVLARPAGIPPIITSGLDTVAVRVPDRACTQEVLRLAGVPVAAPSANTFGRLSPTRASHVIADLGERIDAVLDDGPTLRGVESTIVDARGPHPIVLRLGALPVEAIEAVAGHVEVPGGSPDRPATPGALPSHYAPLAPVRLVPAGSNPPDDRPRAHLVVTGPPEPGWAHAESLSPIGDLVQAAARLFDVLHDLDARAQAQDWTEILVVPGPERGLGRAVNDRLRRAAAHR